MLSNIEEMLPNADTFDIIAVTFQEVPMSKKQQRF